MLGNLSRNELREPQNHIDSDYKVRRACRESKREMSNTVSDLPDAFIFKGTVWK
jgi:hypothetical protein